MRRVPKGVESRKEHDQRRINEIHQAMNRYVDAGFEIPVEWIVEYFELINHEHPSRDVGAA